MWATQREETSNLAKITQGDELPVHEEASFDEWNREGARSGWARGWSSTYMPHALSPRVVERATFDEVTSRYVLKREAGVSGCEGDVR